MLASGKSIARCFINKLNFQCTIKCSSEAIHQGALKQSTAPLAQQSFGQPTPHTHPHLLREREVIPGIQVDEFIARRVKLMQKIAKCAFEKQTVASPHLVVIPSATKVYMSDHIPYVFRQNSDFLYFTGCQEPDSILLLTVKGDSFSSTLFVRPNDAHSELWDGPRTGVKASHSLFKVDQALSTDDFEKYMFSLMSESKNTQIWYNNEEIAQPKVHEKLLQIAKLSDKNFSSPKTLIHELRVIKSQTEIDLMQKSCQIASLAIAKTIELSKPGISEHEIFATVDYQCRMRGAEFLAYPPVVAGGKNANTIHYISNNQVVHDKTMVLMDAGCEFHGYSSDITRTWPINGTFTPAQRILYEIVLEVQTELVRKLKYMPSLDQLFQDMFALLSKRLQEENLLPKDLSGNKLLAAAYTYCPHHVSHYLGMDVHDTPKISRSVQVRPGMIVTVEPGIYVNAKNQFAPREFYNLGIRIEDDVLITESGPVNLTASCPKEVADVEALARLNQT
ncbi:probable Xaa-Pro aminopeptidase 3 [Copidosoma floridanum]|uniref:probable Xaa-Pro aminopeptidase 3 n=1 Tax=Copidosoma floridanum TaxID=29053 RepID=UPI0006C9C05C|nr:probable Xaa-Pro aminopeptidase 3 [Copidosoma floridanum]